MYITYFFQVQQSYTGCSTLTLSENCLRLLWTSDLGYILDTHGTKFCSLNILCCASYSEAKMRDQDSVALLAMQAHLFCLLGPTYTLSKHPVSSQAPVKARHHVSLLPQKHHISLHHMVQADVYVSSTFFFKKFLIIYSLIKDILTNKY